ncbi:LLM class F420-dependent oxidoreductase [Sphaerisporangium krabiense]|uniref:Putative F420-dependent oxidoreductase n=1 Tax=Sphaerisporangium krabiense TaxID=763782 RepID=A0A7W8Z2E7_9ACTN|nr:TIGR03620 family F420-dependent LLM class oxidoreductase [Sphaerisporangium krabiense]MBB5626174.1 putative F420-dependent oxidoreductase [Sphaerisporangium krabiense]GII66159.1 LLM class F420-dependent oxidoreductase [Sphaerisporangium krabiense]
MRETSTTPRTDPAALKERLGRVGVWLARPCFDSAATSRAAAVTIEELGYRALWFGELLGGKEALVNASILLSATDDLMVATGIANIWARDATAVAAGANALAEAWEGRFVLGLGVSHAPLVRPRGHAYGRPVATMRAYLDAMDQAPYRAPLPEPPARVLAALRTRMLRLAAERAQGAHTYFVTPEHTMRAREILGPDPLLAPEQAFVLETGPDRARAAARAYMSFYLELPNYLNSLRELGWSDADFEGGGSDALVDAIVPWGDPDTVAERVRAHHEAGADHVCVQPLADTTDACVEQLRRLAPAVLG